MRQFLITNLYNMYNTGEMMQLKALRNYFDKDKFTIASIYSIIKFTIASIYSIISTDECKNIKVGYAGSKTPQSKSLLLVKAIGLLLQAIVVKIGLFKPKNIISAYTDCDVIIDLGGDTFSDDVSPVYTLAHCFSLLPAIILGKEYIICSQSIGKFKTPITKALAHFILNKAKLITTREAETTRYIIEELKIKPEIIRQTMDLAYLTPETHSQKIPNSIGILTSSLTKKQTGITAKENITMLTRLTAYYLLAGKQVYLIPHVICPVEGIGAVANLDDVSIANKIKKQLNTALVGKPSDVGKVSLVIGSRMHGLISALINSTPVVALSYSHKFGSLNSNSYNINIKEAKQYISKVIIAGNSVITNNQPNISYEISKAKENLILIEEIIQKISTKQIGQTQKYYYGHSAFPEIRHAGASGGIVKSLLTAGLDTNCFEEVLTTEGEIAKTTSNVKEIPQGSTYHNNKVTITEECHHNIGIVCLPCQVKKYRKLFLDNTAIGTPDKVVIGLFCSHAIELEGIEFFIKHFGLKNPNIQYRYKHNGQTGLLIDNKVFFPQSSYWSKFFNFAFIPKQCLRCNDLTSEEADISVGDAHGHPEFWKGENIIVTRTPIGAKLLQNAVELNLIKVEETNLQSVINTQKSYLKIKKGKLTIKLKGYMILRNIGCYMSKHKAFYPLLHLWIKVAIKKEKI